MQIVKPQNLKGRQNNQIKYLVNLIPRRNSQITECQRAMSNHIFIFMTGKLHFYRTQKEKEKTEQREQIKGDKNEKPTKRHKNKEKRHNKKNERIK